MPGGYKVENLEQREAFERYYAMGDKRSLKALGEQIGKAERTVYKWSSVFGWAERVEQRDIEVGRRLEERTITTVVDEKARYRKAFRVLFNNFIKDLQDGLVRVKDMRDLEKLVKLDLLLMGEATERGEQTIKDAALSDEQMKQMQGFVAELKNSLKAEQVPDEDSDD